MTWSVISRARRGAQAIIIVATVAASTFLARPASAEVGQAKAPTGAKATVGLALLSAEAVVSIEAIARVKPWWAYAIGGGAGAAAGAVGGYFIDRADNTPASMSLFVGGLVLAVPTAIAVLSARTYKPKANPRIDTGAGDVRGATSSALVAGPTPVVAVGEKGRLALAVPALSVVPVYSQKVRAMHRLRQGSSFRVPVLRVQF